MRPISLKLEAFGPFIETQTIEFAPFADHGLFLIHGATGSGKSTILDALTYALFDAKSVERGGQEFVSTLDPGATTRVTFDFEHGGRTYRIMRQPAQQRRKLRGDGLADVAAEAELEDRTARTVLATKSTEATKLVQELLNMDVEQFRQTVVLPQGEFRSVITDHQARREVLARVFRTHRFARLTDAIRRSSDELDGDARGLRDRRQAIFGEAGVANSDELAVALAAASSARDAAAAERTRRDAARTTASSLLEAGGRLAASFEAFDTLRATVAALEAQGPEIERERSRCEGGGRAALVIDRRRAHEQALSAAGAARAAAEGAILHVAAAEEALASAGVAAARERERAPERDEAAARERAVRALEGPLADLRTALTAVHEKEEALVRLAADLAAATRAIGAHQERLGSVREEGRTLRVLVASEREERERAHVLRVQATALRQVAEQEELVAKHRIALAATSVGDGATQRWLEDLRGHAAGLLAVDLRPGEACPVCGGTDHPTPHAAADVVAVTAMLDAYRAESGRAAEERAGMEHAHRRAREILVEHGWSDEDRLVMTEVAGRAAEAAERLREIEAANERLVDLDEERTSLDAALPGLEATRRSLVGEHASLEGEVRVLRERVASLGERIEPELRVPGAFEARLSEAEGEVARLARALADAEGALTRASADLERAHAMLAVRGETAETADAAAATAAVDYAERLREQGFASPDALAAALVPPLELERIKDRLTRYDEERASSGGRLDVVRAQLEGEARPDLEALQEAATVAGEAWSEADAALTRASQAVQRLAHAEREERRVQERYDRLVDRLEATKKLAELAAGRLRGRAKIDFETFVIESIVADVLVTANGHFHQMTDGRFTLHLVEREEEASRRGLELEVSDNFSGGERRAVKTLSGGEGFLASLALALGLSESAQRNSGASELGALFIDEGFGSLDAAALDTVVGVLRKLPTGGRLVGVITHVDEMKRRIPAQLLVERQAVGSTVSRRVDG